MKILVTGASGTLGPHLVRSLQAHEHTCLAWDRSAVSPDDRDACARFLNATVPDAIAHLALGAEAWTYLQIVKAIRLYLGDPTWTITPSDDYVHDQRLLDDTVRARSIADRLSGPVA